MEGTDNSPGVRGVTEVKLIAITNSSSGQTLRQEPVDNVTTFGRVSKNSARDQTSNKMFAARQAFE